MALQIDKIQQDDEQQYKLAYFREREARKLAEKALDEKTREIYNSMKLVESQYETLSAQKIALEEAQKKLVQSEKMSSLGQLSAGIAHEINNPICFVLMNVNVLHEYAEVLVSLIDLYDTQRQSLSVKAIQQIESFEASQDVPYIKSEIHKIHAESLEGLGRVKEIVNSLKSFSRPDDGEYIPCDINACLKSTLKVIWNELKYKARVIESYTNIPPVMAIPNQLSQVFMNLIVNAGHAVSDLQGREGIIKISTSVENGHVVISITDNGVGISDKVQGKIFDPFFTTKPIDQGTGLGLSISYGIIEKHHGALLCDSTEGEGTTFSVTLPVADTAEVGEQNMV